jgi:hypothetical protein
MSASDASMVAIETAAGAAGAGAAGAAAALGAGAGAAALASFTFASDARALCPRILPINDPKMLIVIPPE